GQALLEERPLPLEPGRERERGRRLHALEALPGREEAPRAPGDPAPRFLEDRLRDPADAGVVARDHAQRALLGQEPLRERDRARQELAVQELVDDAELE